MISWALLCYSGLSTQRNEKLQLLKCWEMTQTVPSPRPLPRIISPFPALCSHYRVPDTAGTNTESWGAGLRVSQVGFLGLARESTHRVVYYDKVLVHPLMWNRLKGLHFPETLGQWYSLHRWCQTQSYKGLFLAMTTDNFHLQWEWRQHPHCSQLWGLSRGYRQHIIFKSTYFSIGSFLYQDYM